VGVEYRLRTAGYIGVAMSKLDNVSTLAMAFLLTLIALTSWAGNEHIATTSAVGEAGQSMMPLCVKTLEGHRIRTLC
jgi:hypothetical protein